jgi:hypothetical protein
MARLKFKIVPIQSVSALDRKTMLSLYQNYYDMGDVSDFDRDFLQKDHVIVLLDKLTDEIKGFSTQKMLKHNIDGRNYIGVFSGDTIVDKAYWGDPALSLGFFWYMTRLSLSRPWGKIYWHLISKGYKTYLLLSRNFETYYPRYDRKTSEFDQKLMASFATQLYPHNYHPDRDLLLFQHAHEKLKGHVAPIDQELKMKMPEVAFFEQKNPGWQKGDELVCIGHFHLLLPFYYLKKIFFKKLKRLVSRRK